MCSYRRRAAQVPEFNQLTLCGTIPVVGFLLQKIFFILMKTHKKKYIVGWSYFVCIVHYTTYIYKLPAICTAFLWDLRLYCNMGAIFI
jgi:hypothetical protein